jgi:hypothetical protein
MACIRSRSTSEKLVGVSPSRAASEGLFTRRFPDNSQHQKIQIGVPPPRELLSVSSHDRCSLPLRPSMSNRSVLGKAIATPGHGSQTHRPDGRSWLGSAVARRRLRDFLFMANIANSRLMPLLEDGRNRAHCNVGGGSCRRHQARTMRYSALVRPCWRLA